MPQLNYMEESNYNYYNRYYYKNTFIPKIKPKKRIINRKKHYPLKRVISLIFCIALLSFILPYSFNAYIKDVLPSKFSNNLNIDYKQIMFPAHSMFKPGELSDNKYISRSVNYDETLMIDIPESFQRIGLRNELLALADNYKKIYPSVYVWEYNGHSYVDINADEPFPAASIIKVPVLIQLFRDIDQGKFSLYDTMVLEDYYRAGGSGKLQYSQGGIEHTLDHLAKIMIENSDNSSTNMLMSKIGGMPEVNTSIRSWGLKTTSVNNWLPDLDGTNLTTAKEMATMFYNMDVTGLLSNDAKRQMASYLSNVKNTRLLKAGLPEDALILHKTGDIGFMLGDAGIIKSANGKKYITVILVRRPYNNLQGKEFIVKASNIIYNNIAAE